MEWKPTVSEFLQEKRNGRDFHKAVHIVGLPIHKSFLTEREAFYDVLQVVELSKNWGLFH